MTSRDDVRRLRGEGWTIRRIAEALGLSKSAVGRLSVEADDPEADWDDDDLDDLDADLMDLDELNAERWPVPPLTFVGYERQYFERGAGMDGYWADMERWCDANGEPVGSEREAAEMAIYRLGNHLRHDLDDAAAADALEADVSRQRDAYVRNRPQIVRSASSATRRNRR